MSTLVFAGAAQFAAVGYVAGGLAWPGIVLLTALLNARHLLYSAALAPWLREVPFVAPGGDGPSPDRRGLRAGDRPLPADRPDRRTGLLDRGIRGDVHPVEPRDDGRGRARRPDPGPGAVRHRRHLPGGHGRSGGRAHHRPARARRRDRRRGGRRRRRAGDGPVDRDRRAAACSGHWSGSLVPANAREGDRAARLQLADTADRFPMPDAHVHAPCPIATASMRPATRTTRMSTDLVLLAFLMFLVTYPSRALGAADARLRPAAGGRLRLPPAGRPGRPRGARRGQRDGRRRTMTTRPSFHVGDRVGGGLRLPGDRRPAAQPVPRAGGRGRAGGHRPGGWAGGARRLTDQPGRAAGGDGTQPRRASASISTSRDGSMSALTTTSVAAGRISPKTSPWTATTSARPTDVGHEHPGPDDVGEAEAGLGQRPLDDLERWPAPAPATSPGWRDRPSGPASVVPATQHESPMTSARL